MASQSPLPNVDDDFIITARSTEDLIRGLVRHGCLDLRSLVDPTTISKIPCAGGGFGDVHRGTLYDGTIMAIKCPRLYNDSESTIESDTLALNKQASREIYYWAKLEHPNVLPLMGFTIFRQQISMVSQWMKNGDLRSYLQRNPGANPIKLCIDICEGLSYLHGNEMAHGDVKAANVVVSPGGTAMLTDFGSIKSLSKNPTLKYTCGSKRGLSHRWASPELLLAESVPQMSKEADVWASGMTILEVLTGQVPYYGIKSEGRVYGMVAYEKQAPARPKIDLISDELWNILNVCWTWDPIRRPDITIINKRLKKLVPNYYDSLPAELHQTHIAGRSVLEPGPNHPFILKWQRYLRGDTTVYFESVSLHLGRCHYFTAPMGQRFNFFEGVVFALSPSRGTISRVGEDLAHRHVTVLDYSFDPVVQFEIGSLTYQWNTQSKTLVFEVLGANGKPLRSSPQLHPVEIFDDPKIVRDRVRRSQGQPQNCHTTVAEAITLNLLFWVAIVITAIYCIVGSFCPG